MSDIDPIFLIIANSIMMNTDLPPAFSHARKTMRQYIASCIARATFKVSIDAAANDVVRATLELSLLHYNTGDISSEVESALEISGVEVEHTPGSIAANASLNRFSGIDLNEQS